jgi:hypothetical protein
MKKEITKEKIRQVSIGFNKADFEKMDDIGGVVNLIGYSAVVRYAVSELHKKIIKKNESS